LRLDVAEQKILLDAPNIDGPAERYQPSAQLKTTDYGPAIWHYSPNFSSRAGSSITHVAIHTTQGSYSSAIFTFEDAANQVSAHYLIRSSDGQITQFVRETDKAWHISTENKYTLGIEHEGFVAQTGWYTDVMYQKSAELTRHFCTVYSIDCNSVFRGPATVHVNLISTAIKVKGHQHYPNQTHNDPGVNWNWTKYANLLNPSTSVLLDGFELSEGHFDTSPTYSGSTVGIATTSSADRSTQEHHTGSYAEAIKLSDNTASATNWAVRFLSASGDPAQNLKLNKAGGRIGFWLYTAASGITVAAAVDDSDGTERSVAKAIPAGVWTFVEWKLDDSAQWDAWSGGNGVITAAQVTLDAIWINRAQTSFDVYVFLDDVTYRSE
jgi:N-acetylmuramoyl-L-alanine amidase